MNDPHLAMLEFFPQSTDVFKDVAIADGLSIVLKDMGKREKGFIYRYSKEGKAITIHADNPGEDLFPLNPNDDEIVRKLDKVIKRTAACMMRYYRKNFWHRKRLRGKNPSLVREYNEETPLTPIRK